MRPRPRPRPRLNLGLLRKIDEGKGKEKAGRTLWPERPVEKVAERREEPGRMIMVSRTSKSNDVCACVVRNTKMKSRLQLPWLEIHSFPDAW